MKICYFFAGLFYALLSFSSFSIDDAERFFANGQWRDAKVVLSQLEKDERSKLLELLIGNHLESTPEIHQPRESIFQQPLGISNLRESEETLTTSPLQTYLQAQITQHNTLAVLVQGLWHLQWGFNNTVLDATLFKGQRCKETGLELLATLIAKGNANAAYFLGYYHIFNRNLSSGNTYLKKSAQLGHQGAQNKLRSVGINFRGIDQLGDHCSVWCGVPNCHGARTISARVKRMIGCGPSPAREDWVDCNFCLCGISTELNCVGCAQHFSSGFWACLKAFEGPLQVCNSLGTISTTVLQGMGSPYALPVSAFTAGLSTFIVFLTQKEIPKVDPYA